MPQETFHCTAQKWTANLTTCDLLCSMLLASLEVFVPCVLLRNDKQMCICVYIYYIYICVCISQCWPAPVCLQYLSEIYLDFLQVAKEDVDMKRSMLPVTHSRDSCKRSLVQIDNDQTCRIRCGGWKFRITHPSPHCRSYVSPRCKHPKLRNCSHPVSPCLRRVALLWVQGKGCNLIKSP